jgi:4-amino-4-deoxy-L-arabinose transferase-like glycosyltransferase
MIASSPHAHGVIRQDDPPTPLLDARDTGVTTWHAPLRSPRWRATALFVLALCLHLYELNDRPGFPHFFEDNTLTRELRPGFTPRAMLEQPWSTRYEIFREWGNGDVDHVGFSWPWVVAVDASRNAFGESVVAHRLPSAIAAALSPVIFYLMVLRFFRPRMALLSGLLLATSPLHLMFARNGGYVGATLTLLLGLHFFSLLIAVDNSRRAWVGFTALLLLVPYAYAPIRYLALLAFVPILHALVTSRAFRRRHLVGLDACLLLWLACAIPNVAAKNAYMDDWRAEAAHAAQMFYSGSGEQLFTADEPDQRRILVHEIGTGEAPDLLNYHDRSAVAHALVVLRLKQWWTVYWRGAGLSPRVSQDPPAHYRIARLWPPLLSPALSAFGLAYCIRTAPRDRRWRDLLLVAWSTGSWLPLLLTTQVNGNRTMAGLPPDYYFLATGAIVLIDSVRARLSAPRRMLDLLLIALLGWFLVLHVQHYFRALPPARNTSAVDPHSEPAAGNTERDW